MAAFELIGAGMLMLFFSALVSSKRPIAGR
jgi:hypothetical protein